MGLSKTLYEIGADPAALSVCCFDQNAIALSLNEFDALSMFRRSRNARSVIFLVFPQGNSLDHKTPTGIVAVQGDKLARR